MTPGRDTALHHGSHLELLWPPPDQSPADQGVDAIVVPTRRPTGRLHEAAGLARQLGCTLVTLHSGASTAAQAADELPTDVDLLALDVRHPERLRMPGWQTSRLLAGTVFARRTDLSPKRNLALMLSHLVGWSRVLFLDDDISELSADDVRRASGLLDTHNAVGLRLCGFPDHSVVCHAYLESGGEQQTFIGGGALAVEVNRCTSFFPDIYNDDWFFLLDDDKWLQPTAITGRAVQQEYDPFETPERARSEELGDVLAEGIYWLLDSDRSVLEADRWHWSLFLARRREFIVDVIRRVLATKLAAPEKQRRLSALRGSLDRLALITPALCETYIRAWAEDRRDWQRHVEQLPTGLCLPAALALLSQGRQPLASCLRLPGAA